MTSFDDLVKIFARPELLTQAMTHKSYKNEEPSRQGHNEVLEFLGDAVLDLMLAQILMETFPMDEEGGLSRKRASLVNESTLAQIGIEMGFDKYILLGKGERTAGGFARPRLLAGAVEAMLGAIFLDRGYPETLKFTRGIFEPIIAQRDWAEDFFTDFKTRLQEKLQRDGKNPPSYIVVYEQGPAHQKTFEIEVIIDGTSFERGRGGSKKQAEQEAARRTLEKMV